MMERRSVSIRLEEVPEERWGHEDVYEPTPGGGFALYSAGPDGEAGTEIDVVIERRKTTK